MKRVPRVETGNPRAPYRASTCVREKNGLTCRDRWPDAGARQWCSFCAHAASEEADQAWMGATA